jgi:hypothetical protein
MLNRHILQKGFWFVFVILVAIFSYFIWLPDYLFRWRADVISVDSEFGYKLTIYQTYSTDFYLTRAIASTPSGEVQEITVDPDDTKWWPWNCKVIVDYVKKQTSVVKDYISITYDWQTNKVFTVQPFCTHPLDSDPRIAKLSIESLMAHHNFDYSKKCK